MLLVLSDLAIADELLPGKHGDAVVNIGSFGMHIGNELPDRQEDAGSDTNLHPDNTTRQALLRWHRTKIICCRRKIRAACRAIRHQLPTQRYTKSTQPHPQQAPYGGFRNEHRRQQRVRKQLSLRQEKSKTKSGCKWCDLCFYSHSDPNFRRSESSTTVNVFKKIDSGLAAAGYYAICRRSD